MTSARRHPLLPATILATLSLLAAGSVGGCSRQNEGERCSLLNGNLDCDEELLCIPAGQLRGGTDDVDRCCPATGESISDSRCAPRIGGSGNDDDNDAQGGAGGATDGGGPVQGLGDACQYTSDCVLPLVCGPTGACQYECQTDRDCTGGKVCSSELTCVSGAGGSGT